MPRMLRSSWTAGPADGHVGGTLVSVTDFTLNRRADLVPAYLAGRRLAAGWQGLAGAVGLWLWAEPATRRCGSVSFWLDEQALRGFVAWPEHVAIMRRFRGRGDLVADSWTVDRFDPNEAWRKAALRSGSVGEATRISTASRVATDTEH